MGSQRNDQRTVSGRGVFFYPDSTGNFRWGRDEDEERLHCRVRRQILLVDLVRSNKKPETCFDNTEQKGVRSWLAMIGRLDTPEV